MASPYDLFAPNYLTTPGYRSPALGPAPDFSNWAYMPGDAPQYEVASNPDPESLPSGWSSRTLVPGALALMGQIPGIGPLTRNPDAAFAAMGQQPRISVGKGTRNPVPASDPPPSMFGVQPDTLPLINSVEYSKPTAAPAAPTAPARKPFDWGPDASLWPMLMQAGAAMMQPSYYGLGGQLQQGLTAAGEAAQKAPMQRAQRRLLEAQVGKAEAEAQTREWAKQLYADTRIPMPVRMAALFKPESIPELMKELDEPTQALLAKYAAAKAGLVAGATERAKLAPDIVSAEANKAALIEGAKTAATGGNTTIAKLFRDRDNALAAGDTAKARAIQAEIDKEAAQSEKAKMDATTAGANIKAAQVARQDFETAVAYFVDPKTGKVNPEIRTQGMVPWSNARNQFAGLKQAAINFASAKGGKALTEPEIAMYIEPNLPSALDNDAGVRMKLARLRRYLDSVGGTSTAPTTSSTGAQRYRMGTDGAIR